MLWNTEESKGINKRKRKNTEEFFAIFCGQFSSVVAPEDLHCSRSLSDRMGDHGKPRKTSTQMYTEHGCPALEMDWLEPRVAK